jgi:hypothetical protein
MNSFQRPSCVGELDKRVPRYKSFFLPSNMLKQWI